MRMNMNYGKAKIKRIKYNILINIEKKMIK